MVLMVDRTPQKTNLKSPAIRIKTPKRTNLESPSRVKRMSFTELDADFEDENLKLGVGDDTAAIESPTEAARPAKRNGLTQQTRRKPYEVEGAEIVEEEEELDEQEEEEVQDYGGYGDDFGGGFGDDSFDRQDPEDEEEVPQDLPDGDLGDVEEGEEGEEDIYGREPSPPPVRRPGRPKASEKPIPNKSKKPVGRPPKRAGSTQPAPKRARTTSSGPRASSQPPKIIERKEIPHPADISMMDSDGNSIATILT
jgi:hypothetical protein